MKAIPGPAGYKAGDVFVLNVGDGDAIIVRFPPSHGKSTCAIVDCFNSRKTIAALKALKPDNISFVCATHPHFDHIKGMLTFALFKGIGAD